MRSRHAERLFDIVIAGGLLVSTLPVLAVVAIAVRLDSSGPVFHRAIRTGQHGCLFTLYKFRTMVIGAAALGPAITTAADPRVTRVGRLLRRTKLDELPQLWNVLVGDMRLVGPRPEDPRFVALYGPEQRLVLAVCPGITGPAQLAFFDEEQLLTCSDPEVTYVRDLLPRKLALDLDYVSNHDLRGDFQIIVASACLRCGAWRDRRWADSRPCDSLHLRHMSGVAASKRSRQVVGEQPGPSAESAHEHLRLRHISVDRIDVPPRPARRFLGDIAALAESMQDYGLQQPISVRAEKQRFVLTSGLRRLSAARTLHWTTIPAFVRTVSADHAYLLDLIENLQRQDLSPEEEADALGELIRTRGWSVHQVAHSVKRSVGYVSKRVRVFEDPLLREAIASQGLPVSTAEELLASHAESRGELIQLALVERWDQARARDALRAPEPAQSWLGEVAADGASVIQRSGQTVRTRRPAQPVASLSAERPKGLTRAVREFHRLLLGLRADCLTHSDRAALRALFRDLVLMARSPSTPRQRVIPPLPKVSEPSRRSRTNPTSQGRTGSVTARRKSSRT